MGSRGRCVRAKIRSDNATASMTGILHVAQVAGLVQSDRHEARIGRGADLGANGIICSYRPAADRAADRAGAARRLTTKAR
jgi:hypothetical protein